ncbi:ABC transporter permease [soil metagenome]
MFKNYILIAWRNLMKRKIFSFINIFGLSVGLTCCLLIGAYLYSELTYDTYPKEADNIYRVDLHVASNGSISDYPLTDVAVGAGIKNAFPEVKASTRLTRTGGVFIKYKNNQFKEEQLAAADSNFLQVFSILLTEGNITTALLQPNSIVITKTFAQKYFGNEAAMGKMLEFGNDKPLKVTGVIDALPDNMHFHFNGFISMATFPGSVGQSWSNIGYVTYLLLDKNADAKKLESKFPELVAKFVVPEIQHDMGVTLTEAQKAVNTFTFSLMPIKDIHLNSHTKYEIEPNGDIQYVYIFGALAVFILLLACVNFTNLSTAGASKRAKEVGIRKVAGSVKSQLVFQFLAESLLLTFCAMLFAYMLVYMLLPYFNPLSGKHIQFAFFLDYTTILAALVIMTIVGVLAGIYPAFFLSSFKTINILKGNALPKLNSKNGLRSGLVVFQFAVSTALIIATIVVYQQLNYMQNKKLGYDKDQVLLIQDTYTLGNNEQSFKQTLLQDSRVVNATISRSMPGGSNMDGTQIYAKEQSDKGNHAEIHINIFHVDYDYLQTLGMQMAEGRNLSKDFPSDSSAVVINETAAKELGWNAKEAVGKTIVRSGQIEYKVAGVVKDFNYASARQIIAPLMMMLGANSGSIMVKMKAADVKTFLADSKTKWDAFNSGAPFSYSFLDENFAALYSAETRTGQIFTSFAIIAIVIAGLGLFGLSAFTAEQRTKEIGIRKVLGASVQQVLFMLSRQFLVLVIIAFIVAIPVTWWAMHTWLQDFAYRITIAWWVFLLAGAVSVCIAFLSVSFQAIKAAIANPVKSLKTE